VLHTKALARKGEVFYKLRKYTEALGVLGEVAKFVKDEDNVTTDPLRQANRKQALALAEYYSALCHRSLKQWADVISVLAGYEKRHEDMEDFHPAVLFERVRAYLETDDLGKAEVEALTLRDRFPDSPRAPIAFQLCALEFYDAAQAAEKANDKEGWKTHLLKAAEYFEYYLSKKDRPTPDDWDSLGVWFYLLGDWPKATEYLQRARNGFAGRVEGASGTAKTDIEAKVVELEILLSEILLEQGRFSDARGYLEGLLMPDAAARSRVLDLLVLQEHTDSEFEELKSKMALDPRYMEGLARVYQAMASQEDLLRAMTLLNLLSRDKSKHYTPPFWNWQLRLMHIYLEYGQSWEDRDALENVVKKYDGFDALGVLDRSGRKSEFTAVKNEAERLLR
jgi:tetratricopeptide (TPR) repeat protein